MSFQWQKPSIKQLKALCWWRDGSPYKDYDTFIAHGAIRSSKTLSLSFSFIHWSMETFDGLLFGMAGKTIGSFRKNVLRDLKSALKDDGYHVQEKFAEKLLIISKGNITNTYEIFGGKDEASQDLIQGRTLAGIFLDEAVLMPESFVNQAISRCSVPGSKIWITCNPGSPFHYLKTEFIDQAEEKKIYVLHFVLDDNPSLSEKIKDRYKRMFKGFWYNRFILGLWVLAEGIIYDMFDEKKHTGYYANKKFKYYAASVDYGTTNPFVINLFGWDDPEKIHLISEFYYNSNVKGRQKTDSEYADDFQRFTDGYNLENIFIDPSAASFILELRKRGVLRISQAKNDVSEGIKIVANYIGKGWLLVSNSCKNTIKEFSTYSWDANAQKRGEDKPSKQNDHSMDAIRYFIYSKWGGVQYRKRKQDNF